MNCKNCGYELEHEAISCFNCGYPVDLPSEEIEPIPTPEEPLCAEEPLFVEEPQPMEEAIAPCMEEPPAESQCQDEPCICPDEEPQELQEPLAELSFAEKLEQRKILEQDIEELKSRIQPLLDSIVNYAKCASPDNYADSLDCIVEEVESVRAVDCDIKEKNMELCRIVIKECCERNFLEADRFCGVCGGFLGETGWACHNCQGRNKANNIFCRGCGKPFEIPPPPKQCSNPDCARVYPDGDEGYFCNFCGWAIK